MKIPPRSHVRVSNSGKQLPGALSFRTLRQFHRNLCDNFHLLRLHTAAGCHHMHPGIPRLQQRCGKFRMPGDIRHKSLSRLKLHHKQHICLIILFLTFDQLPHMLDATERRRIGKHPSSVLVQRYTLYFHKRPFPIPAEGKIKAGISIFLLRMDVCDPTPRKSLSARQPFPRQNVRRLGINVITDTVFFHRNQGKPGLTVGIVVFLHPYSGAGQQQFSQPSRIFYMAQLFFFVQRHPCKEAVWALQESAFSDVFIFHFLLFSDAYHLQISFQVKRLSQPFLPQQFLYFFPLPQEVDTPILSILSIFIILLIFQGLSD